MEFLIRAAEIIQPNTSLHKTKKDILIANGMIQSIEDHIDFEGQIVSSDDLKVSVGWVDMRANYNDPGLEHKEDLDSGAAVALASGFTDVVLTPNTVPVVSNKNALSYYKRFNKLSALELHPVGALTERCEGKELTEMIDLHTSGAKAFSDGSNAVWHTDLFIKALQYLQKFDGLLIDKPEDKLLTSYAQMHEGEVSTYLGMKGMPSLAESLTIHRNLELLAYAGGKLHVSLVSTEEGLELIRGAKMKGLNVTCDVGVNYLMFEDNALNGYDTNLKVNPPYRLKSDREALLKGVLDGTIDTIVSDHNPQDIESKKLEFDLAEFGSANQQSFYSTALAVLGDRFEDVIPLVTSKPRKRLGIESQEIKEGAHACLTLFDPKATWEYNSATNKSKSMASPFFGKVLSGKVIGVANKGQLHLNEY